MEGKDEAGTTATATPSTPPAAPTAPLLLASLAASPILSLCAAPPPAAPPPAVVAVARAWLCSTQSSPSSLRARLSTRGCVANSHSSAATGWQSGSIPGESARPSCTCTHIQ